MIIPRHWIREMQDTPSGQSRPVLGWSDVSEEDARAHARTRWRRILSRISGGQEREDDYSVAVREPIVSELEGPLRAVITRNRYGARVLNCERLCFIDIDKPRVGSLFGGISSLWRRLRGLPYDSEGRLLERVRTVAESAGLRLRVYRTHSGWRIVVLNRTYDPASDECDQLFRSFPGADRLYRELCRKQDCFRARLSPKPWRIKATGFPDRTYPRGFPWADTAAKAAARDWVARYEETCAGRKVCDRVGEFGSRAPLREILAVMEVHDAECGVNLLGGKLV